MKLTTLAALASSLAPASAYLVTGDPLNCRSGPGTNYEVKKTYPKNKDISITCQTAGTAVSGNVIWDKTSDGCYVSDYYVKTGISGYVTDKCGSKTCVAPSSNQATVALIAEFEGFVDHVCTRSHPSCAQPDTTLTLTLIRHRRHRQPHSRLRPPVQRRQVLRREIPHPPLRRRRQEAPRRRHEGTIPSPFPPLSNTRQHISQIFEKCLTTLFTPTKVTLNANQYGALVSWAFNMGCPAVEDSTLAARLKAGADPVNTVLAEELPRWVHAGGVVFPGLVRRRKAEVALAKKPTGVGALPADC